MLTYFGVVEKGWYSGLFRILYLGWRTLLPILEWWRRAGTVHDMVLLPMLEWWRRAGTMYTVKDIVPGMEDPVAYIGVVEKGWSNVLFRILYLEWRTLLPILEWWRRAGPCWS